MANNGHFQLTKILLVGLILLTITKLQETRHTITITKVIMFTDYYNNYFYTPKQMILNIDNIIYIDVMITETHNTTTHRVT